MRWFYILTGVVCLSTYSRAVSIESQILSGVSYSFETEIINGVTYYTTAELDPRHDPHRAAILGMDNVSFGGITFNVRMHTGVSYNEIAAEPHYFRDTNDPDGARDASILVRQLMSPGLIPGDHNLELANFVIGGDIINTVGLVHTPYGEVGSNVLIQVFVVPGMNYLGTGALDQSAGTMRTWISFAQVQVVPEASTIYPFIALAALMFMKAVFRKK